MAPLDGYPADQVGHLGAGHSHHRVGGIGNRQPQRSSHLPFNSPGRSASVQLQNVAQPAQIAQYHRSVSEGGGGSAPGVARWAGPGTSRLGPHPQTAQHRIDPGERTAAGADRHHLHHWMGQSPASDHRTSRHSDLTAGDEPNVEAGAAHVGGYGLGPAQPPDQLSRCHKPSDRAGLKRLHRAEGVVSQAGATAGLHDVQGAGEPALGQRRGQGSDLVGHQRGHVGVEHRGHGPLVLTDAGGGMRQRHMGAGVDLVDQLADPDFVSRVGHRP